jgi:hypothetical protein
VLSPIFSSALRSQSIETREYKSGYSQRSPLFHHSALSLSRAPGQSTNFLEYVVRGKCDQRPKHVFIFTKLALFADASSLEAGGGEWSSSADGIATVSLATTRKWSWEPWQYLTQWERSNLASRCCRPIRRERWVYKQEMWCFFSLHTVLFVFLFAELKFLHTSANSSGTYEIIDTDQGPAGASDYIKPSL